MARNWGRSTEALRPTACKELKPANNPMRAFGRSSLSWPFKCSLNRPRMGWETLRQRRLAKPCLDSWNKSCFFKILTLGVKFYIAISSIHRDKDEPETCFQVSTISRVLLTVTVWFKPEEREVSSQIPIIQIMLWRLWRCYMPLFIS